MPKVGKVIGLRPVLSQVLVEMLSPNEALGSSIEVSDRTDVGATQAYVLALGPSIESDKCGFQAGDRVILQGSYIPVPNFDNSSRKKGIVEIHNIKGVLLEEGD